MYDLWFTLGTAIIDPALLDAVNAAGPVFQLVKEREITEKGPPFTMKNTTTAGLLEEVATTSVRKATAAFLAGKAAPAPPVSILTAGKLCQFLTIPGIGFAEAIKLANTAWTAVAGAAAPSAGLIGFIGVCFIDPTLSSLIQNPAGDLNHDAATIGTEFRLSDAEKSVATAFVNHPSFAAASTRLFNTAASAAGNPWLNCCTEQIVFWSGKNEHAVL